MKDNKRSQWSSGFGFIMAAAGAAVGLGNIWGFPYKLGAGGGCVFLICYLFFVVVLGYPVLVGELALGRHYGKGAVGTYTAINKKYKIVGIMGVVACFIILGYYIYFGGVIIEYTVEYAKNLFSDGLSVSPIVVGGMSSGESVVWMLIFIAITFIIVIQGVQGGIERCSMVMMPALLFMLIYLAGRSLSMSGAKEAIEYMFRFDLSQFSFKTISLAAVQVFFSISLGQGIMITYGSYLSKKESIEQSSIMIPLFDTATAVLAAVVIIPAVFSYNMSPDGGPRLMFDVLPMVFSEMGGGNLMGFLFFLLLCFASITSTISMLETVASSLTEELKVEKKRAAAIISVLGIIIAVPVCIDPSLFSKYEYISEDIMVIIGAFITCIICGWQSTRLIVEDEVEISGFKTKKLWRFLIRYIAPILVILVLLVSMRIIKV